jgi:hypothetical protein
LRDFWTTALQKNPAVKKNTGYSDDVTPKIARFSDDVTPKIPWSRKIAGFSDDDTPKKPRSRKIAGFWTSSRLLKKSRGLKIVEFSDDDTPKIPRSQIYAGFLDDNTPKKICGMMPTSFDGWTQGRTPHWWRLLMRTQQSKLRCTDVAMLGFTSTLQLFGRLIAIKICVMATVKT